MRKFIITTDTASDLGAKYLEENNIKALPLYYSFDDVIYGLEQTLEPVEFYNKVRSGILPVTMAVNPEVAANTFKELIKEGYDILHIGFSSALSSSYNSAAVSARELCEENPDVKITVIDSLCASLGAGLLVHKAIQLKNQGKTMDEVAQWVEDNKLNIRHIFTVNDLFHLHRGGRVSKTSAIVGSLINVKPILHINHEGRLIPQANIRGRKKSLQALVNEMEKDLEDFDGENSTVFISHADCIDDAHLVANMVKEKFAIEDFYINQISPTIGSHTGADTVGLFFMGEKR